VVIAVKEINNETPVYNLFRVCALLDDGDLTGTELLDSELCLDALSINRYTQYLLKVGFVKVNGMLFSLTERGKVFVEKMADVYKFMLSIND